MSVIYDIACAVMSDIESRCPERTFCRNPVGYCWYGVPVFGVDIGKADNYRLHFFSSRVAVEYMRDDSLIPITTDNIQLADPELSDKIISIINTPHIHSGS